MPHDAAMDSAAPADVPSTDVLDTAVTDTGVDSGVAPVMPVAAAAPFVRQLSFAREKSGERTVRRGGAIAAR